MDIRFCEYMAMIAEEQSLSKAAQKLFITQSALSQQLAKMESELGTRLFVYTNSKMMLTETGEVFLKGAQEIMDIKKQAYEKIASLSKHYTESISIAVSRQTGSLLLSECLPVFKQKYPNVKVNINESDTFAAKQLLINGAIDLALLGESGPPHPMIQETFLYNEELVMILPNNHPLAERCREDPLSAPDLHLFQDDDFILSKPGTNFRMLADSILKQNHIIPNILCEINNFYAVRNMVQNGFGIAFLPITMTGQSQNLTVVSIRPRYLYRFVIAHHKNLGLSGPLEYLAGIMIERCKIGI